MQTEVEQKQPVKSSKGVDWRGFGKGFVSLRWYDGLIEFLFRFVAKTSEPLLALGLVISAADVLTEGRLMAGNPDLSTAWAWTQAIAIESSGGVVLVYALQSFRDKDPIKGALYVALAILLAAVGGMMLYSQMSQATGAPDVFAVRGSWLVVMLVVLRVLVSVGYVVMCRTKHIRFADLKDSTAPANPAPAVQPAPVALAPVTIDYDALASKLEGRVMQRVEAVFRQVEVRIEQATGEIQAIKASPVAGYLAPPADFNPLVKGLGAETPGTAIEAAPADLKGFNSYEEKIASLYRANKDITATEAGRLAGCSIPTASKWLQKARGQ